MQINDRNDLHEDALNLDVQIRTARDEHVERVLSLRRRVFEIGAKCRGRAKPNGVPTDGTSMGCASTERRGERGS
jgi:hypothetical protein